jgi:hypothetical protein
MTLTWAKPDNLGLESASLVFLDQQQQCPHPTISANAEKAGAGKE